MPPPPAPMRQPPPTVSYGVPPPTGAPLPLPSIPNGVNQPWPSQLPPPSSWPNSAPASTYSTPPPVQNTVQYQGGQLPGQAVTPQPFWTNPMPHSGPNSLVATPPPQASINISNGGDPFHAKWAFNPSAATPATLASITPVPSNQVPVYQQYHQQPIQGQSQAMQMVALNSQPPTSKLPYNDFYQSSQVAVFGQQPAVMAADMTAIAHPNGGLGPQRVANYIQPSSQVQGYHPYRRS